MNTISKFIINRNNLNFIYVEKRLNNNNAIYYIYCDEKSFILPPEHFQSIYATDKKISIKKFLLQVQTDLIGQTDSSLESLYNTCNNILKDINSKDIKNPSLSNNLYSLCNLLDKYNAYIYEESQKVVSEYSDVLNYEDEYQRLIKQEI